MTAIWSASTTVERRWAMMMVVRPPHPADQHLRRSLIRGLGRSTLDDAHTQGRSLSPTAALGLTSSTPTRNLNSL